MKSKRNQGVVLKSIDEGRSRRGVFGLIGRAGLAAVGVAAGVVELQRPASAAQPFHNWNCCDLAFGMITCKINGSGNYVCPNPATQHMTSWCCCTASRTYNCGECVNNGNNNCDVGPWYCSAGWTVNPRGCTGGCSSAVPKADPADLARWNSVGWAVPTKPRYTRVSQETP